MLVNYEDIFSVYLIYIREIATSKASSIIINSFAFSYIF